MSAQTGLFVYGIVPGDVEPTAEAAGVGEPPAPVDVVRRDELAALVSRIRLDEMIGRPADLTAYKELLDGTATVAPVLPVRFGTVLADEDAVTELLDTKRDDYRAALDELDGRVQYVLHARYVEQELLAGVLAGNPEAAELARAVRGQPVAATREARIRLGELISGAIERQREADTGWLVDALAPVSVASADRPPGHEQDAAHLAFLVDAARETEFVEVVEGLAAERREQIRMRLLGPLAPYDFVDLERRTAG